MSKVKIYNGVTIDMSTSDVIKERPHLVISVGYLLKRDKTKIVLIGAESGDECGATQTSPYDWVQKVTVIRGD